MTVGDFSCGMWVLYCSMQTLSCGMWNLVPWPGIESGPLYWEHEVLATGPQGKSQRAWFLIVELWVYLFMEEKALVEKKLRIQERGGVADEERLGESRREKSRRNQTLREAFSSGCFVCRDIFALMHPLLFQSLWQVITCACHILMMVQHPLISALKFASISSHLLNYCGQISSEYLWNNTGVHL